MRGRFTPPGDPCDSTGIDEAESDANTALSFEQTDRPYEWCHRRLLARIHRLTLDGLRRQIEPVSVDVFIRFLARHFGLQPSERRAGSNGLFEVISMLQGLDIPAICWEQDILPSRIDNYTPSMLDELCISGEVGWGRLFPPKVDATKSRPMASVARIVPMSVWLRTDVGWLTDVARTPTRECLSSPAVELIELLEANGAMFAADLADRTRMLPSQLEDALGELVSRGLLTADGFAGLRQLSIDKPKSGGANGRRRDPLHRVRRSAAGAGRWSLWRREPMTAKSAESPATTDLNSVEQWAWQLLRRWGVIFRDLLDRESGHL